jgi:hypothetical protein
MPDQIDETLNEDDSIDTLTLDNLETKRESLENLPNRERERTLNIERRLTDDGRSFAAAVEEAQRIILSDRTIPTGFLMLGVPLADTNGIAKEFKLKRFTDEFKDRLHREIVDTGLSAGMLAGRFLLVDIGPSWTEESGQAILDRLLAGFLADPDYGMRLSPERREEFRQKLNALRFVSAHAYVPLDRNPAVDVIEFQESSDIEKAIESKSLAERREILAGNLAYWRWQDRSNQNIPTDLYPKGTPRSKAGLLSEFILQDIYLRLNEQVELLEKIPEGLLKKELGRILSERRLGGPAPRIEVLDDETLDELRQSARHYHGSEKLQDQLENLLQAGRAKGIPVFRYTSESQQSRFVRPTRLVPRWDAQDPRVTQLQAQLDQLLNRPSPEALDNFKKTYRRYRLATYEGLVLGYRDARLEEVYKLDWMNEVLRADERGAWRRLRAHLSYCADDETSQKRVDRLMALIQPGVFVAKRAVGDETDFIVKDMWGRYRAAFSELNKGNAYFLENKPDSRDSTYHRILLAFVEAAHQNEGRWNPLCFLSDLDTIIQSIAPEKFKPNEKVPTDQGTQRLPSLVQRGSDSRVATHARDFANQLWERDMKHPSHWSRMEDASGLDLVDFQTHLSASRVYTRAPIHAGQVEDVFLRSDQAVGHMKDFGLSDRVLALEDLEALHAGHPHKRFTRLLFQSS